MSLEWLLGLVPSALFFAYGQIGLGLSLLCLAVAGLVTLRSLQERSRRAFVKEVLASASRDELTGLASRKGFLEALRSSLASPIAGDCFTAVFYIDLDSFKSINDTLGHTAGDRVLSTVAQRLNQVVIEPQLVGRMGGDELAILVPEVSSREQVIELASAVMEQFSTPIMINGEKVWSNASVGIVMAGRPRPSADDLLVMADTALYQAKNGGKGQFVLFEPSMPTPVTRSPSLDADLRSAIVNQEFVLHFQPIVNLGNLSIDGFEALIRWEHPRYGTLGPTEFIPLAEETGLIRALGDWVIERSFQQISIWQSLNSRPMTLNINLSALQFRQRDMLGHLWRTSAGAGLQPGGIVLEITESFFLQDDEITRMNLSGLQDMGFGIAIDDFGVGYSSLSYLKRHRIDVLKVDQSFLAEPENPRSRALLDGIIQLGHSLNIGVIAEGIETVEQLKLLQTLGCERGQGFLLGTPLTEEEVVERLVSGAFIRPNLVDAAQNLQDRREDGRSTLGIRPA
ncbi:MAG TPA: bifunctional diguanylate cyclase/phosphodiesterase [Dehalococcoidia bacterium]|nr:bifunctional diguanylate cyclase/phosphodiesterase [Dehalococcoidia bacterium]